MSKSSGSSLYIVEKIPGVKWTNDLMPLCSEHNMQLNPVKYSSRYGYEKKVDTIADTFQCLEGPHIIKLPFTVSDCEEYVKRKWKSKDYAGSKLVDIDGVLTPVSKEVEVKDKDGKTKFWVTAQIKASKNGQQLVIYAGEKGLKGGKEKCQLFINPGDKRLGFDQNNMHPADLFAKIEATFRDGTKSSIKSGKSNG